MTTPINTFQDILDALERDPALRQALRTHVLTEELIQLPAVVHQIRADVDEMKQGQARLEEGQARLEAEMTTVKSDVDEMKRGQARLEEGQARLEAEMTTVKADVEELKQGQARLEEGQTELRETQTRMEARLNTMGGQVSHLMGTDYQGTVTRIADRLARRHLGLHNPQVIAQAHNGQTIPLHLIDKAISQQQIDWNDVEDMDRADIILQAVTPEGEERFVVAEVSITVQQKDLDAAANRARLLTAATGVTAMPVAIGAAIQGGMESHQTRFIPFNPDEER